VRPTKFSAASVVAIGLMALCSPAWSQTCGTNSGVNKNLSLAAVNTLLTGNYACANLSPTEHWNELHSSPYVLDYKKGPTDPVDPSDTPSHPTGTYVITGPDAGTVTYTYPDGGVYGYTIKGNLGTTSGPGLYSFCTSTGGINIPVTISAAHC
jgi:hypothetical protein